MAILKKDQDLALKMLSPLDGVLSSRFKIYAKKATFIEHLESKLVQKHGSTKTSSAVS